MAEKANEITVIPKLQGTVVTIDAIRCQRDIPGQSVTQGMMDGSRNAEEMATVTSVEE